MSKQIFKIEGLLEIDGNDIAFRANNVIRQGLQEMVFGDRDYARKPVSKDDVNLRRAKERMEQKSRRAVFSAIANAGRKIHVDEIANMTHLERRTIESCISDIRTTGHDVPAERTGSGAFYRYMGKKVA